MPNIQHKRGTRAALNALASSNSLLVGQIYFITDENRLAIATSASAYESLAKQSESGSVTWNLTTITLPDKGGVFEWKQTIVNALVTPSSTIDIKLAPARDDQFLEYDPQFTEISSIVATPNTGSFDVSITFRELHSGPINLQYTVN